VIVVDYYFDYINVDHLKDTRSKTVINKLKHQFARHGIPDTLVSDNGPQYSSDEFKTFTSAWQIEYVTLPHCYPQSSGKAESAVKITKNILRKAKHSGTDPYLSLDHRSKPAESTCSSLTQRLMSRRTKTLLPPLY